MHLASMLRHKHIRNAATQSICQKRYVVAHHFIIDHEKALAGLEIAQHQ
ncbi:MAG: hypothetical protein AB8B97_17080 [Granulosicoccus sp.]